MHLLIVEDEEKLAKSLKKGLEMRGYAVDWLPDAVKARSRIIMYRNEYDLVLMDLMMPELDGAALTEQVRAEGVTTPIVILTARDETEHKVEPLNKGADDYIVKPFSFEELIARINSVLRRPAESKSVVLQAGAIEMDTATRTVRVEKKEVDLTLKEFSLLECFMREPNIVLDVHMKNLRKKISTKHNDTHFETVRGVGYKLVTA